MREYQGLQKSHKKYLGLVKTWNYVNEGLFLLIYFLVLGITEMKFVRFGYYFFDPFFSLKGWLKNGIMGVNVLV